MSADISTDISVDISTDISVEHQSICRPICQSICRPIYRLRGAQNTHGPELLEALLSLAETILPESSAVDCLEDTFSSNCSSIKERTHENFT